MPRTLSTACSTGLLGLLLSFLPVLTRALKVPRAARPEQGLVVPAALQPCPAPARPQLDRPRRRFLELQNQQDWGRRGVAEGGLQTGAPTRQVPRQNGPRGRGTC